MEIRKVGVLGCGLMGSGIAQVEPFSGRESAVADGSPLAKSRAQRGI